MCIKKKKKTVFLKKNQANLKVFQKELNKLGKLKRKKDYIEHNFSS